MFENKIYYIIYNTSTRINKDSKNINYDESKHLGITNHMLKKNHTFDWHNKKILDFENSTRLIKIMYFKNFKKYNAYMRIFLTLFLFVFALSC